MSAAPAVLAIDGGNSKSDLALVAGDGTPLATVRGPGMASSLSLEEKLGVLGTLIGQAQQRAGLHGSPAARHLSACLANADLPEEEAEMAAALRAQGWSGTTEVVNDTFALLRAGLDTPSPRPADPGATGESRSPAGRASTAWASHRTGRKRVPRPRRDHRRLGRRAWPGQAALWWAIRAEDGRGPDTELRAGVAGISGCRRSRT